MRRGEELRDLLEAKVAEYNRPSFVPDDPIAIPHGYTRLQDVEVAGLMAATFAWGQRKTILAKTREFLALMDNSPYEWLLHHQEHDRAPFADFKHRTFTGDDALYFVERLAHHYGQSATLEDLFLTPSGSVKDGLVHFHDQFFCLDHLSRTRKHVATPARKSACKRLNMFLRWMVRHDGQGVDLGVWRRLQPSQLVAPCDVHSLRVSRHLGLLRRQQVDWQAAEELTAALRALDPHDPVKYDFALYGLGVFEAFP